MTTRAAREVRVIQYGLGEIGAACARAATQTPGLRLVGAVDIDPAKVHQPLARLLLARASRGAARSGLGDLAVSATLAEALRGHTADAVIHTTQSSLAAVAPQLEECMDAGLAVVSSTEELALPRATDSRLAARLDRHARQRKVALLGTGVNPGFVMDLLPVAATGASRAVRRIEIERVLDAGARRPSFQRKVGVGMSAADVRRRLREGSMGHVGLLHSALLVAEGCGLEIDAIRETGGPVIAEREMDSAFGKVERGRVAGLHQTLSARRGGKEVLRMKMVMALGVPDPHDSATIHGEPPVRLKLEGGLWGDGATVSVLLNAVPRVIGASPGLHTVLDLPVPRTWNAGHGGLTRKRRSP